MITPQTRKNRTPAWRAAEAAFGAAFALQTPAFKDAPADAAPAAPARLREGRRPILGLAKNGLN